MRESFEGYCRRLCRIDWLLSTEKRACVGMLVLLHSTRRTHYSNNNTSHKHLFGLMGSRSAIYSVICCSKIQTEYHIINKPTEPTENVSYVCVCENIQSLSPRCVHPARSCLCTRSRLKIKSTGGSCWCCCWFSLSTASKMLLFVVVRIESTIIIDLQ